MFEITFNHIILALIGSFTVTTLAGIRFARWVLTKQLEAVKSAKELSSKESGIPRGDWSSGVARCPMCNDVGVDPKFDEDQQLHFNCHCGTHYQVPPYEVYQQELLAEEASRFG